MKAGFTYVDEQTKDKLGAICGHAEVTFLCSYVKEESFGVIVHMCVRKSMYVTPPQLTAQSAIDTALELLKEIDEKPGVVVGVNLLPGW